MELIQGTDNSIKIKFDENGEPLDITGYTILFTVKAEGKLGQEDTEAIITKDIIVHSDAENGESVLDLTRDDTNVAVGTYYWDLRLIKDGKVTQTKKDKLSIIEGVTERIS